MEELQIEELLTRALSGSATSDELIKIDEWIAISDENKDVARQFCWLHTAIKTADTAKNIKISLALKSVNERIEQAESKAKKKVWINTIQKIAACFIIPLIGFACYYYINQNSKPWMIEVYAQDGQITEVTLPDSSKVWLNKGSLLKYPSTFSKNSREVYLEGEAYFDVMKDVKKRFIVNTALNTHIEVKGTEFNVEAYVNKKLLTASLVTGAISMTYVSRENKTEVINITPNQRVEYNTETRSIKAKTVDCILTDVGWKSSKIILSNSSLEDLLRALRKKHDINFTVKRDDIKDKKLTGTFTDASLKSVFEVLKVSSDIKYTITEESDGKITVELY